MVAKASKSHRPSHAAPATHSLHSTKQTHQSFWFRLWIGFLIGFNLFFIMADVNAITSKNPQIAGILTVSQGVTFIILGVVDIFFMIQLIRWKRYGFYGTALITFASMVFNMYLGAGVFQSVLWGMLPLVITLFFVSPHWGQYK